MVVASDDKNKEKDNIDGLDIPLDDLKSTGLSDEEMSTDTCLNEESDHDITKNLSIPTSTNNTKRQLVFRNFTEKANELYKV